MVLYVKYEFTDFKCEGRASVQCDYCESTRKTCKLETCKARLCLRCLVVLQKEHTVITLGEENHATCTCCKSHKKA